MSRTTHMFPRIESVKRAGFPSLNGLINEPTNWDLNTKKNQSSNLALVNYLNDDVFSKQQGESQVHLPV